MRPFIVVALIAGGLVTMAGFGLLLLVVALALSASSDAGYPADYSAYPGTYPITSIDPGYSAEFPQPTTASPADRWVTGDEIDGRWNGGTIDRNREGNDVYRVGTEVLTMPN